MKRLIKKITVYMLIAAMSITGITVYKTSDVSATTTNKIKYKDFLKANGKVLKNNYGQGDTVYLRGTNAGGYMLQEFWLTPTDYTANVTDQTDLINTLTNRFGSDAAKTLINTYESNYWKESDFDTCASLGINCIRLPIWYRNFVDENNNWYSNAFDRVDWFVEQAGKRGIYVIIDMHGAYGSQNGSDHSGVDGGNDKKGASEFFFGSNAASNQEKYYQMWEKIAEHYNSNPVVAGYDLLNEPYNEYRYNSGYSDDQLHSWLWNIYDNAYKRIRAKDPTHVIIMEATWEPTDLPNPDTYGWENVMYEYHNYLYDDYENANGQQIANMQKRINNINSANYNVPSYMGEFSYFNSPSTWEQGLKLLNDSGLNWTNWTYKCVSTYGNWGLVNQSVSSVNAESDSYDTILAKWSNVGSGYLNTSLTNVFKKYTPGVISSSEPECMNEGSYYLGCTDNIVTAVNSGNSPLSANKSSYSSTDDVLEVINNGNGTISLKSKANGKYVCAVIDENNQLLARSNNISLWEQFEPVHVTGNQYALRSIANGKYVKADFDDSSDKGQLKAVSDNIGGAWECFNFYSAGEVTTDAPTAAPTEKATENDTSGITISDDVKVEGFQISNILEGLRTVSSVEPSINGKNVVEFGNIYAVDVDSVSDDDMYVGVENKFVAAVNSTSNGITDRQFSKSDTATNYVMTMTDNGKTVPALTQSYKIRAYAKLSDGTYLYSKVAKFSIFNVAKTLYDNSKMNTNAGHEYLYDNILKVVDSNYKKVDYDWSVIVVK
ncbi:hypothetical protein DWW50_05565 [Eubacterium sp. AF15-50]|uniref:Cellulase family glycosylhydrolase n=1 Tax=Eubacterium segne TaxID=2763045 RepID=A0ABR7EYV4_9FIRM|nr:MULTISPECIES: cellulase family glycosylhydrolase [Eubacterium]MBC5666530.1 cellulase family glycosylhydrolase [Eubacterium segne]RHR72861.1 hypothetical protein DWW68_04545 [Eubacterium sp. AF16-48]RHR80284.1 hypothetical protein DWW50_05565 [Eubacterium sp. AF15-50]